jgi:hypothetical protein
MKKQIIILLAALTFVNAHAADVTEQVRQQKSVLYFIENKGQVIDQDLNPNPAVKYPA